MGHVIKCKNDFHMDLTYGFLFFFQSYKGSFDIFRFTKKNIFIFIWTRRRKHLFYHYLYQVNVIDLFLLSIDSLTSIRSTDRLCPWSPGSTFCLRNKSLCPHIFRYSLYSYFDCFEEDPFIAIHCVHALLKY